MLDKTKFLHKRDEKGTLLPIEIELKGWGFDGEVVKIRPCTIGRLSEFLAKTSENGQSKVEDDRQLIIDHCVEPSFTEDELCRIQWDLSQALVNAILRSGGIGGDKKK